MFRDVVKQTQVFDILLKNQSNKKRGPEVGLEFPYSNISEGIPSLIIAPLQNEGGEDMARALVGLGLLNLIKP